MDEAAVCRKFEAQGLADIEAATKKAADQYERLSFASLQTERNLQDPVWQAAARVQDRLARSTGEATTAFRRQQEITFRQTQLNNGGTARRVADEVRDRERLVAQLRDEARLRGQLEASARAAGLRAGVYASRSTLLS